MKKYQKYNKHTKKQYLSYSNSIESVIQNKSLLRVFDGNMKVTELSRISTGLEVEVIFRWLKYFVSNFRWSFIGQFSYRN